LFSHNVSSACKQYTRQNGHDCSAVGKITEALAESNGRYD